MVLAEVVHDADHLLASAAIPLVLPPVRIHGRLYCDGSLRQHVPLSPALHLGAARLVVVTTQTAAPSLGPLLGEEREAAYPAPLYMMGKALGALTLDRMDEDLDRLEQLNRLVAAGEGSFGPGFLPRLNHALGEKDALRRVESAVVRPSEDIGRLAADFVRSPHFRSRTGDLVGRLFAQMAEGETAHDAELLSHLLFDGRFALELIALGRADARTREEELGSLLARAPRSPARASG
jgi:NTE family protein